MTRPIKLLSALSASGTSAPAQIDIDSPEGGLSIATTQQRLRIYTSNGKRKISAKNVIFERFAKGINGSARDSATPLFTSVVPISGPNVKSIEVEMENEIYALIQGNNPTIDTGLRIRFDTKDRQSDTQYMLIGYYVLADNEIS